MRSNDLNGAPMRFFHQLTTPDVIVEMDASDYGLCALDTRHRRFITHAFSSTELQLVAEFKSSHDNNFDINFRELLSVAFAVYIWKDRWARIAHHNLLHVHFRIDNTSAVAWQSRMSSKNPRVQELLRLIGHWKHGRRLRFSSSHIPGLDNVRADLGSRLTGPHPHPHRFASLTHGWSQDRAPGDHSIFPMLWRAVCERTPLPPPPLPSTPQRLGTGAHGVDPTPHTSS